MAIEAKKIAAFKVRPVNHGTTKRDKNRYCGPAVLSIMSGITTGDASRLIRSIFTSVHAVRGTSTRQIDAAFDALGIRMSSVAYRVAGEGNPTLAGWLRQTVSERTPGRVFLLIAGNHWQIVTGRRYVCGIVGDIVSVKDKRIKRRARVTSVFELTPKADDGKIRVPVIERPKSQKTDACRTSARKLMRDNPDAGIGYELDQIGFGEEPIKYVYASNELEDLIHKAAYDESHPAHRDACCNNDGRYCYDWQEVEYCIEALVEFHNKWGYLS